MCPVMTCLGPFAHVQMGLDMYSQGINKGIWMRRAHWNAEVSTKNFWWMYAKASVRGTMAACGCGNLG